MIVQIDGEKFQEIIEYQEDSNRRVAHNDDWNVGLQQALNIFWSMAQTEGEGEEGSIEKLEKSKDLPKKCHNTNTDYAECDQFVCSNCGIELQDWHQVERDEDDGDITYREYEFHFCPNCGAKIEQDDMKNVLQSGGHKERERE